MTMLGTKKKNEEKTTEVPDRDALDTLRHWIKDNFEFGYLKPNLTIQNGVVERIKIHEGDLTISVKVEAYIK